MCGFLILRLSFFMLIWWFFIFSFQLILFSFLTCGFDFQFDLVVRTVCMPFVFCLIAFLFAAIYFYFPLLIVLIILFAMSGDRDFYEFTAAERDDVRFLHKFLRPGNGAVRVNTFTLFKPWVSLAFLPRPGVCLCFVDFLVFLWRCFSFLMRRSPAWAGVSLDSIRVNFPDDELFDFNGVYVHYIRCPRFLCLSCVERCRIFSNLFTRFIDDCIIDVQAPFIRFVVIDPRLKPFSKFELCAVFLSSVIGTLHRLNVYARGSLYYCPVSDFDFYTTDQRFVALVRDFCAFFHGKLVVNFAQFRGYPCIFLKVTEPTARVVGRHRKNLKLVFRGVPDSFDLVASPDFVRPIADLYFGSDQSPVPDGMPLVSPGSASGSLSPHFAFPPLEHEPDRSDSERSWADALY